jgi:hypothetical protein
MFTTKWQLTSVDEASYQDRQRLVKDYKLKTIIDLRTKYEGRSYRYQSARSQC